MGGLTVQLVATEIIEGTVSNYFLSEDSAFYLRSAFLTGLNAGVFLIYALY